MVTYVVGTVTAINSLSGRRHWLIERKMENYLAKMPLLVDVIVLLRDQVVLD